MPDKISLEQIEEYLDHCEEGGAVPRLVGPEPFDYLWQRGYVVPFYTTVRVMYTGMVDVSYFITEAGKLVNTRNEDPTPEEPREVLSEVKNPDGWEVEKLRRR